MPLNLVPQPTQTLAETQNPILQNFTTINANFLVNHVELGTAGAGKHKFLQMPETAAPTTAANEAGFYANVGTISAVTELFFRRENNGDSIPMTETVNGGAVALSAGWTRLPSGIIVQWQPFTITVAGTGKTVTFPRPFTSACYGVFVQEVTAGGSTHNWFQVISGTVTTTQARITSKDGNGNASTSQGIYFAIGK